MRARSTVFAIVLMLLTAGHTAYALMIPPTVGFRDNELARIIAWHLPSAWIASFLILAMGYFGAQGLFRPSPRTFARLEAVTELGILYAAFALLTGILFSRVQWGAFWQWDPRQTSFLFLFFLLCAALALRAGFGDAEKRDMVSAAYAAGLSLPALFLIFVYPRLPQVQSFHPKQGSFDTAYWTAIAAGLVVYGLWAHHLAAQRIALGVAARTTENEGGPDDLDRPGGTPNPVVRPVSL